MTVIQCMIPETLSTTDRFFCHFGPFFALLLISLPTPSKYQKAKLWKTEKRAWRYYYFTHVYHKWQSYDVWILRHWAQQTDFFVILDHFLPFYPSNNPISENFDKKKKNSGDIINLHICTINDNHMMYGSSDMERDEQNTLSFWTIFCPFTLLKTWKIKIPKKWK